MDYVSKQYWEGKILRFVRNKYADDLKTSHDRAYCPEGGFIVACHYDMDSWSFMPMMSMFGKSLPSEEEMKVFFFKMKDSALAAWKKK